MTEITIRFDEDGLANYTETHLAALWHVSQANPAPITDRQAGDIAERIGHEIIRRWLEQTGAELWAHQGRHAPQCELSDLRQACKGDAS